MNEDEWGPPDNPHNDPPSEADSCADQGEGGNNLTGGTFQTELVRNPATMKTMRKTCLPRTRPGSASSGTTPASSNDTTARRDTASDQPPDDPVIPHRDPLPGFPAGHHRSAARRAALANKLNPCFVQLWVIRELPCSMLFSHTTRRHGCKCERPLCNNHISIGGQCAHGKLR